MATRSLRNRSSRYSSPATFGDKQPTAQAVVTPQTANGVQSSLDKWIEPTVRAAVPSFEDTKGLERLGVLENMQPLGLPPTQKLLQRLKLNYTRPSPRATPVQHEEVNTVATESEGMDTVTPVDPEILSDAPLETRRQSDTIIISSPPCERSARRESVDMSLSGLLSPATVKLTFTPSANPTKPASIQEHLRQDRIQSHIERAVQEAHDRGTPNLVPGLERIRADAQDIPELWNVLEAVVHRSATDVQFKIFKRYIKAGIKDFRRASQTTSASPLQLSPYAGNTNLPLQQPRHSQRQALQDTGFTPEANRRMATFFDLPRSSPDKSIPPKGRLSSAPTPQVMANIDPALQKMTSPVAGISPNKRKRSRSVSSSSSLSSAKSMPEEFGPPLSQIEGRASRSAGQRQAANRASGGIRLRVAGSATTHPHNSKQPSLDAQSTSRSASKKLKRPQSESEYDIDELARRKRGYLGDSFHDYNTIPRPESDERDLVHGHPDRHTRSDKPPPPVVHPNRLITTSASLSSPASALAPSDSLLFNAASRERGYDEVEADEIDIVDHLSPPNGLLHVPLPSGAANLSSRSSTPRSSTRLQPAPKTRKSARVMVSPNKHRNGGITAGISRAGPGRDVAIGNGADSGAEDNDEFCASCGGEGKLLCCDGCTNSFHHACLEPPLSPEEEVDGEWYCPRCVARQSKSVPNPSGLLGMAIRRVDDTIPKAFALPLEIREYFEGVRTGEEGEYEEVGLPRTQNNALKMNRAGFIEEPNYKDLRDSKGNLRICYRCGHTPEGRDIIACDYCPAKWHLDCIDPPLAVPPRRRGDDKPTSSWRCPLHIDNDLSSIHRQAEAAPGDLGRIPRLRKPKNAVPLDVEYARGFKNNGLIEVELVKDDFTYDKTKEVNMHGKIYRVPENAIRLDFIDRVHKSWYEDQSFPRQMGTEKQIRNRNYRPDGVVLHHPPDQVEVTVKEPEFWTGTHAIAVAETARANAALRKRSIREQQTVLSLAEMSRKGMHGFSGDVLAELTNSLVSEAPHEVVEAVEQNEYDQLMRLQVLISRRLAVIEGVSASSSRSASVSYEDESMGETPPPPSKVAAAARRKLEMVNGHADTNTDKAVGIADGEREMEMEP